MDAKTVKTTGWADQAAKVAHETVDRLRDYAAAMEADVGQKAAIHTEEVGAGLAGRAKLIGEFIEANPVPATLIAFGVGLFASRMLTGMGALPGKVGSKGSWAPPGKAEGLRAA